jgi:hypothetical protein
MAILTYLKTLDDKLQGQQVTQLQWTLQSKDSMLQIQQRQIDSLLIKTIRLDSAAR